MFLRTIALTLLLAATACSGELPPPTAQEAAFGTAVAPYCGPLERGRATCNVYIVSNDSVALISGYSDRGYSALVTNYDGSSYTPILSVWLPVSRFGESYELVGPNDLSYEVTHRRYLRSA